MGIKAIKYLKLSRTQVLLKRQRSSPLLIVTYIA